MVSPASGGHHDGAEAYEGAGAPTSPHALHLLHPAPADGPGRPPSASPPPQPAPKPAKRRGAGQLTAVAVLAALLASGGTAAATHYWPQDAATTTASTTALGSTAAAPVKQGSASAPDWTATASGRPSVVSITATLAQGGAQGSGVIIDKSGHVLTNNHVVSGAQKPLTVTLSDGRTYDAEVRGTDPSTDLAVITIKNAPSDLAPVAIGDSDKIAVGDPVMAVGNPLGLAGP